MGQARQRGSFIERKAQAIAVGREKKKYNRANPNLHNLGAEHFIAFLLANQARRKAKVNI